MVTVKLVVALPRSVVMVSVRSVAALPGAITMLKRTVLSLSTTMEFTVTPVPEIVIDGLPPDNGTEKPAPLNTALSVLVVARTLPLAGLRLVMLGATGTGVVTVKLVVAVPLVVVSVNVRTVAALPGAIRIKNWMVLSLVTLIDAAVTPLPENASVGGPPARPTENPVPVRVAGTNVVVLVDTSPLAGLRLEMVGPVGATAVTVNVVVVEPPSVVSVTVRAPVAAPGAIAMLN